MPANSVPANSVPANKERMRAAMATRKTKKTDLRNQDERGVALVVAAARGPDGHNDRCHGHVHDAQR